MTTPGGILYGFTDDEIRVFPGVVLKIALESTAEVTEKPVETGLVVTDHVKINPLHITAMVQVSPVALNPEQASTMLDATATLQRIKTSRSVCTVFGDMGQFEEMVLISFGFERSQDQGTGAEVTLEFKQLNYATSITSAVLPRRPRERRQVNRGAQSTTPAPRRSLSRAMIEDFTGLNFIRGS